MYQEVRLDQEVYRLLDHLDLWQVGKIIKLALSRQPPRTSNQGQCYVLGGHFRKKLKMSRHFKYISFL